MKGNFKILGNLKYVGNKESDPMTNSGNYVTRGVIVLTGGGAVENLVISWVFTMKGGS